MVELCAVIREPDSGGAPREFSLLSTTRDYTAGTSPPRLVTNTMPMVVNFSFTVNFPYIVVHWFLTLPLCTVDCYYEHECYMVLGSTPLIVG